MREKGLNFLRLKIKDKLMTKKTSLPALHSRTRDVWAEHRRWLERAEEIAHLPVSKGGSPHPSVQVGAVLVDARGREVAAAANRFAEGVDRRRSERYKDGAKSLWINCAEQLALMDALRKGKKIAGARLYVTLEPCAVCAGLIAELKIAEIYVPVDSMRRYAKLKAKWKNSIEIGLAKLEESGVRIVSVDTHKAKKR
jgi:deoxycytidylate deaminase